MRVVGWCSFLLTSLICFVVSRKTTRFCSPILIFFLAYTFFFSLEALKDYSYYLYLEDSWAGQESNILIISDINTVWGDISTVGFFKAVPDQQDNSGVPSATFAHVPILWSDRMLKVCLQWFPPSLGGWWMHCIWAD